MRHAKTITFLLFLFFYAEGFTQEMKRGTIGIGLGANFSGFQGMEDCRWRYFDMINLGINYSYQFHENHSIQFNTHFIRNGAVFYDGAYFLDHEVDNSAWISSLSNVRQRLNYLIFPVIYTYSIAINSLSVQLRTGLGPYVGLLMNGSYGVSESFIYNTSKFNRVDAGISFSIGYRPLEPANKQIECVFRYNLGLTPVSDLDKDIKNRSIQICLFYLIPI